MRPSADEPLIRRWIAWCALPFPDGLAGEEVQGVSLGLLDTFAAGCVQSWVARGALDEKESRVLASCAVDLDSVLAHLDGEALAYFAELRDIVRGVLERSEATEA